MSPGQDSHRLRPHLFSATVGYSQSSLTRSTLFIESRSPWRKVRERRSKMKRRKKESAYSVHRTWDCFLGPSIRMELTGRVHPPPAEPVWGGSAGSVWNDRTFLCWSMGQWRSTQLSQSPGDHTAHQRSFISTTPPAHTHHDLRKASHTRTCSRTPGETNRVCVCMG